MYKLVSTVRTQWLRRMNLKWGGFDIIKHNWNFTFIVFKSIFPAAGLFSDLVWWQTVSLICWVLSTLPPSSRRPITVMTTHPGSWVIAWPWSLMSLLPNLSSTYRGKVTSSSLHPLGRPTPFPDKSSHRDVEAGERERERKRELGFGVPDQEQTAKKTRSMRPSHPPFQKPSASWCFDPIYKGTCHLQSFRLGEGGRWWSGRVGQKREWF